MVDIATQIAMLRERPFQPVSALASGVQTGYALREMRQRKTLQDLLAGGNIEQAAAIDPQATAQYSAVTGAQRQERLQSAARLAAGVLSAPAVMRPQVYAQSLSQAQQMGMDVSQLPQQYSPDAEARLQFIVNQARSLDSMMAGPEYEITEIGVGDQRQKAYVPKRPGASPVPIGDPYTKTPATQVTIGAEKAEATEFGKELVKQYSAVAERAGSAEDAIAQLSIAKNIDVSTGALEPLKASTAAFAESLGFDPAKIGLESATNAQAFTGIMQNLVLTKMQAQKGPQTENDAKRIEATLANLKNTPEAKDFLIDTAIALEERAIEQRDFYEQYRENKGTLSGANKAWNEFKNKTPLFGKNPSTGRPVFYNQFRRAIREANPGASDDQILKLWREKYGRAN